MNGLNVFTHKGPMAVPIDNSMTQTSEKIEQFEVFYDQDCGICRREIDMIRRKDSRNQIVLINIAAPDFDASAFGISLHKLMREIHGRYPNREPAKQWITGVEVFREIYSRLGFRSATRFSRLPVISHACDLGYQGFSYLRFKLAMRRMNRAACQDGVCNPPNSPNSTESVK